MRKERILNEKEKFLMRKKIEENRIKRLNMGSDTKLIEPTVRPESVGNTFNSDEEFMIHSTINFDSYINKIIAAITSLKGFQDICPDDQLTLVKYGCIEIKMLRAIIFYRYEYQCWVVEVHIHF
ncbi:unnamed protein product [Oppiella nova]|uniref:Uncharacterized protein n=1 Tax=Oppiella nova TaxID=334625 RepID=A0A7R9LPM5_9ACAR|nr:unnamed protein product [Oppiella nova]CAG2165732.1 unnamed protein product [Oppiella nova]